MGYSYEQIGKILEAPNLFWKWMSGQTMAICAQDPQRQWIDDESAPGGLRLVEIGPSLCDEPHGTVVYPWDLERYLAGLPVID